jgi:hypothetical protein
MVGRLKDLDYIAILTCGYGLRPIRAIYLGLADSSLCRHTCYWQRLFIYR